MRIGRPVLWAGLVLWILAGRLDSQPAPSQTGATLVKPVRATQPVPDDPDDPAIWVNSSNPSASLILGTVKTGAPKGGLAIFELNGRLRTVLTGPNRPNNVDVEYGMPFRRGQADIAVLTERDGRRLRAYAITDDGRSIEDVSGASLSALFGGARGDAGAPMGIALYKRQRDAAIFALVAPKSGPRDGYLWQYRLQADEADRVQATFVRRFGVFSGNGEIEAVVVDDGLGYVYYADEQNGVHKWHADPDHPDAARELALFGTTGYRGDREGIGIYSRADGTGYIVSVDQVGGDSIFNIYRREGEPGRPHDHGARLGTFRIGADETDGLDITSAPLGPEFPNGLLVAMNSRPRNFLLVGWDAVAAALADAGTRQDPFRRLEEGRGPGAERRPASNLSPGTYDLGVYAFSTVSQTFNQVRFVRLIVK